MNARAPDWSLYRSFLAILCFAGGVILLIAEILLPSHGMLGLLGVVRRLVAEHGPIDFVESNGEHWLEIEGRLRDDLGIPGLKAHDVRRLRSKLAMAEVFEKAGVPFPPGIRCSSSEAVRDFAGAEACARSVLAAAARGTAFRSSSSPTAVREPWRPSGCRPTPSSRLRSSSPWTATSCSPSSKATSSPSTAWSTEQDASSSARRMRTTAESWR